MTGLPGATLLEDPADEFLLLSFMVQFKQVGEGGREGGRGGEGGGEGGEGRRLRLDKTGVKHWPVC